MKFRSLVRALLSASALLSIFATGCMGPATSSLTPVAGNVESTAMPPSTVLPGGPLQSTSTPVPGKPVTAPRSFQTAAMIFVGSGTWSSEITSIETILTSHGASFQEASSAQLDAMSVSDLENFGVLIFPGGEGGTEAGSLSAATHANLRQAVQQGGVSYLGFCAGSFIAVAPAPAAGQDVSYGLGIVNGPLLDYYNPLESQNIDYAMTLESFPDGSTEDILWYGGPVTPSGPGEVIAKYPDGSPAISQMWSGNGFVVLSGVHPTADQTILNALGEVSSDGVHTTLAWDLINAALTQNPMPAF